jgi:hypothetical protein
LYRFRDGLIPGGKLFTLTRSLGFNLFKIVKRRARLLHLFDHLRLNLWRWRGLFVLRLLPRLICLRLWCNGGASGCHSLFCAGAA